MQLNVWLRKREEKKEDEPNSLTLLRKVNHILKEEGKLGMNGEDLACLEHPAASARTLMIILFSFRKIEQV